MINDRVTAQMVAKLAGVSQSAVSRTFTEGASVSLKTESKVRRAAEELGYRPNILARAMITGQSRIIGFVVSYLENQFYPEAMAALSVTLQKWGYNMLMFMAPKDSDDIQSVMAEILDYQVEGIILASVTMSSNLAEQCDKHGIPVVLFNRDQSDTGISSVTTDNYEAGKIIAQHFISQGNERIGYIAGYESASTQREREKGFCDELKKEGRELYARECGEFSYQRSRAAALEMFSGSDYPEAVFVANDHMAFAVMDVLRFKLGLSIPQQVSVVGFDDVSISSWPTYNLTTYQQPMQQMVDITVDILLERISQPALEAKKIKLPGQLILRGTTQPRE